MKKPNIDEKLLRGRKIIVEPTLEIGSLQTFLDNHKITYATTSSKCLTILLNGMFEISKKINDKWEVVFRTSQPYAAITHYNSLD